MDATFFGNLPRVSLVWTVTERRRITTAGVRSLASRLLEAAGATRSRADYLRDVLEMLLSESGADEVQLWVLEKARQLRCRLVALPSESFTIEVLPPFDEEAGAEDEIETVARQLLAAGGGTHRQLRALGSHQGLSLAGTSAPAVVMVPVTCGDEGVGILLLSSRKVRFFDDYAVALYEELAPILGAALVIQRANAAMKERVKELTCLYAVSQVASYPEQPLARALEDVVAALPSAWQYPEVAAARIVVDDGSFTTPSFRESALNQRSEITVAGRVRGFVEVVYTSPRPALDEGPFLAEECSLLETVARHTGLIVERHEALQERARLEVQLRHADRLATIGQLAAGLAHELNEPLANILGFAQLAAREEGLAESTRADLDKIVAASLYAREIVRKLLLFARQQQPSTATVDLNRLVEQGVSFLGNRAERARVGVRCDLSAAVPAVVADPSQLHQVVVNLVVNALQATSPGGRVVVRTRAGTGTAVLEVEDTGAGMDEDVRSRIFLPFYTTKDVDQGTGLGLSVVHGIVAAHGGSITVDSTPGRGSRFTVELPASGCGARP